MSKALSMRIATVSGKDELFIEFQNDSTTVRAMNTPLISKVKNLEFFEELNAYWSGLSYTQQGDLFGVYKQYIFDFQDAWNAVQYEETTRRAIKDICALHPFEKLNNWVRLNAPRTVREFTETYIKNPDDGLPQELTLVIEDYYQMMVMSLALKPLYPMISAYSAMIKQSNTTPVLDLWDLLSETYIFELPILERILSYNEFKADSNGNLDSLLIVNKMQDPDDFPRLMLAGLVFNRFLILPIFKEASFAGNNYFKIVHKYTQTQADPQMSVPSNSLTLKRPSASDDNSKQAQSELRRVTEEVSIADMAIMAYYLSDYPRMLKRLLPNVTENQIRYFEDCLIAVKNHIQVSMIHPLQYDIVGLVVGCLGVPPEVVRYMSTPKDKDVVLGLMALCQTYLWFTQQHFLGLFVTAKIDSDDSDNIGVLFSAESSLRIPQTLLDALDNICPYVRSASNKVPKANLLVTDITQFSKLAQALDIRATAPEYILAEYAALNPGGVNAKRIRLPQHIKTSLAQLYLTIDTLKEKNDS